MEGNSLVLSLHPGDLQEARRVLFHFKPGDYTLTKAKKKRSLDANAYAWVLIERISAAVGEPPLEVYRNAVRDMGGVSSIVCALNESVDEFERAWTAGHLGRMVERMPSKVPGCTNLRVTYGSSDYDVAQMSRFIDSLVQDCHALGIETRPEEEVRSLLEQWGERR